MNTKILLPICCIFLSACTLSSPNKPPIVSENHSTYVAIGESASTVSQTLIQLGAIEQAAYPPQSVSEPPDPATYGMGIPASIDWEGPVGPITKQIANATSYTLRVLGSEPSIPVIVSINKKNTPIGEILRDIGYQCKNRASIVVFPSSRTIELRYAKS